MSFIVFSVALLEIFWYAQKYRGHNYNLTSAEQRLSGGFVKIMSINVFVSFVVLVASLMIWCILLSAILSFNRACEFFWKLIGI